MKKMELDLRGEKKRNSDLVERLGQLERTGQVQRDQLKDTRELLGVKERDLEIERKQRHRAEKKASELELRLMELDKQKRDAEEWRRADELRGKIDKEEMKQWVRHEKTRIESQKREAEQREVQIRQAFERTQEEVHRLRQKQVEQENNVKELVDKLNQANRHQKLLEDSKKGVDDLNVTLRKQNDELTVLYSSREAELQALKDQLIQNEKNYKENLLAQEKRMDLQREQHQQAQIALEEKLKQLQAMQIQRDKRGTSLSKFDTQNNLDHKAHAIEERNKVQTFKPEVNLPENPIPDNKNKNTTFEIEPHLAKVIVNNKVIFDKDIASKNLSGAGATLKMNESLKSLSQFNFSNQKKKISLEQISRPKKVAKFSIESESRNPYFRLNKTTNSISVSRGGRSISPSPVRRIKLEDRRGVSSQQPARAREYTRTVYSSAEKKIVGQDTLSKPQDGPNPYVKRVVTQSIRVRNAPSNGVLREVDTSANDYYFVNNSPKKPKVPQVGKVGDILNHIKTNIEANNFKTQATETEKYEISELSSFAQSQLPKEDKQGSLQVYHLQVANPPGLPSKNKFLSQNELDQKSSYRYTKKKVQTTPHFEGNIAYTPRAKEMNRTGQPSRILDVQSQFGSDEESELNFMMKTEEDVDNQFEVFKKNMRLNFK